MPWDIKPASDGKGYFVVNRETGKRMSDKPISRSMAKRQIRAIHANYQGKEISATPTATMGHGEGGLFSVPGMGGAGKKRKKKLRDLLVEKISKSFPPEVAEKEQGMFVIKEAGGRYRWVTLSSNAYRDRDEQIVSTKSLENDCERADADGDYGTLRWWHVPGAELGTCDYNAMVGRVLVESGTFFDDRIAEAIKEVSSELQVSIGFYHPASEPDEEGVFHSIRRFERSLLPKGMASNPFTALVVKGEPMATNKEKKIEALRGLLGDDELVNQVLQNVDMTQKSADEAGIAFKGTDPEPPKDPEETTEEVEETESPETEEPEGEEEGETTKAKKIASFSVMLDEDGDGEAQVPEVKAELPPKSAPGKLAPKAPAQAAPAQAQAPAPAQAQAKPAPAAPAKPAPVQEPEVEEEEGEDEEEMEMEMPDVVGNMTMDEFSELLADALAAAIEPYLAASKEISDRVQALQSRAEKREKEVSATADELAEMRDALAKTQKELADARAVLKQANGRIKELEIGVPSAAAGFVASQSPETVLGAEEMERFKEATPRPDPLADFMRFALNSADH